MKKWGLRYSVIFLFLLTFLYFILTPALAHSPVFEDGGSSPETAFQVNQPDKSWVFYSQLTSGDIRYYSFEMTKGERIVLGLTIPVEQGNQGFNPDLVFMGPGFANEGNLPRALEIPQGYGAKVFSGNLSEPPEYEAFSPSAFYSSLDLDLKAPENGTYYVAVSSSQGEGIKTEGNYGLVLGYKELFTLEEWVTIPLNQIKIYQWQGQSLPFIFAPLVITFLIGLLAIYIKREEVAGYNPARLSGISAGIIFLGTGALFIVQMLISLSKSSYSSGVFITVLLIIASIGLGVISLVLSLKDEEYGSSSIKKRLSFTVIGIAGLLLWAGFFVGPILAFEAVILPWRRKG
jgi:hypothetical protein